MNTGLTTIFEISPEQVDLGVPSAYSMAKENDMKTCSVCKIEKPLVAFGWNQDNSDGYQEDCKPCRKLVDLEQRRSCRKTCYVCKIEKSYSDFYEKKSRSDGHRCECKKCSSVLKTDYNRRNPGKNCESSKAWQRRNPEKVFAKNLKYSCIARGITPVDFEQMLADQKGVCAMCKTKPDGKRLHIDHDHETGRVRGLLCIKCNLELGWFEKYREAIAAYLA